MRIFIWISVVLICLNVLLYGDMALGNFDTMQLKYKRALDVATYAGAKYRDYSEESYLENIADGQDENIILNKDKCLQWFYRIFYRNIHVDENEFLMKELKQYIILKAIICYDKLCIADVLDHWIELDYNIQYGGKMYRFTLSDQVYDMEQEKWMKAKDIGLTNEERQEVVTNLIKEQLNNFLS